jgi:ubiquinone/menaquinone biosynthesis C-methylase UbiE
VKTWHSSEKVPIKRKRGSRYTKKEILRVYANHPLRLKTILRRIIVSRQTLQGLTEYDLAFDRSTQLTDQNHIGGAQFSKQLARRAGVSNESKVLDLGCGLGGPARILAATFGCAVHGIDLSPNRCRDAMRLTELVGLSHLVTFECGDSENIRVPRNAFDVLWGQSAWVHIAAKPRFFRRWAMALNANGRLAAEDAFLLRAPSDIPEKALLGKLERQWKAYLDPVADWQRLLSENLFKVTAVEDLTTSMKVHFRNLIAAAAGLRIPREEAASWRNALSAAELGLLGYFRIIARR